MKPLLAALLLIAPATFAHQDDDESVEGQEAWVVVRDDRSVTMHGDMRDLKIARRHFKEFGPGYLWFRRGGKEYVVRDGTLVQQILDATRPQEELGQLQGKLGHRQAELGQQQAKLGQQQAQLGQEQARTALRRARGDGDSSREERAREREHEREIEETQRELGNGQQVLGREQEKIGQEQEKMGRQQEKLAKEVQRKVEETIEASLKSGQAQVVN
jgi:hypothetical protein